MIDTREQLASIAESEAVMTQEFEWKQFLDTFTHSSDRVRYLMIVILIASFVALILWTNARQQGWMDERITTTRNAIRWQVGDPGSLNAGRHTYRRLREWAVRHKLYSDADLRNHLRMLEQQFFENSYHVKIPLLDLTFDINDLGSVVGISLSFLTLVLLVSVMRQHENLYLCLYSVQYIANDPRRPHRRAEANLLYHSLAMAQVFSNPPTLARWKFSWLDPMVYLIFAIPLIPEWLILRNDQDTNVIGKILDSGVTSFTDKVEVGSLVLTFVAVVLCCLHERACRVKWKAAFFAVNPAYRERPQRAWIDWVDLRPGEREVPRPRLETPASPALGSAPPTGGRPPERTTDAEPAS